VEDCDKLTPLHFCARTDYTCGSRHIYRDHKGGTGIAKVLIENGIDVDATDRLGYTALDYACDEKRTEMLEVLVEHGAGHGPGWQREEMERLKREERWVQRERLEEEQDELGLAFFDLENKLKQFQSVVERGRTSRSEWVATQCRRARIHELVMEIYEETTDEARKHG